jgi:hypothetical protein
MFEMCMGAPLSPQFPFEDHGFIPKISCAFLTKFYSF